MRTMTLVLAALAVGADWPGFRNDGTGFSTETNLPAGFTDKAGLRWTADLPGRGVSGVVTFGGHVYVTASGGKRDDRLYVLAYDEKSGNKLWERQLAATGSTDAHPDTCMAAPTPVADATGVYALFASGDIAAFSPDGTLRWYRSLVGDYPTITNGVGMASSPVLAAGRVIVPMDNYGESFIAALDPKTGENAWKTARSKEPNWVTPVVRTLPAGKTEVLFPGKELAAYDAETGTKVWAAPGAGGIPSPILVGSTLLMPSRGVTAYKLDGGDLTELWKSVRIQTGMSTPAATKDKVYAVTSSGVLMCADAKTGKIDWDLRVKGKFSASPVVGDGKVYLFSEEGKLVTVQLGDEPEVIATSSVEGRGQATPTISNGAILIRTDKKLYCVGK